MAHIRHTIEAEIPALRRYARALVRDTISADDLVQECLTRALDKFALWREGTNLRTWLFTILHNQYVSQKYRPVHTDATVELDETWPPLRLLSTQDKRLELRDLDRALSQLSEEQRAVVLLVGLEDMSYFEVSEVLGVPVGTVRSRLSRGRLALRGLMGVELNRHSATKTRAVRREAPSVWVATA
jgi:RNA polymerase sigma-70 factor, ECF subfamily